MTDERQHDGHDDGADEIFDQLHDGMPHWTVTAVWTTKTGVSYTRHACGLHTEPRCGEMNNLLDMQLEEHAEAADTDEMVRFFTLAGRPVAIHPDFVGSIEMRLIDPDGRLVHDIAPGFVDRDGPVERDEDGVVIPGPTKAN